MVAWHLEEAPHSTCIKVANSWPSSLPFDIILNQSAALLFSTHHSHVCFGFLAFLDCLRNLPPSRNASPCPPRNAQPPRRSCPASDMPA